MNIKLVVLASLGVLAVVGAVLAAVLTLRPRVFIGHLSLGFETSSFVPCGAREGERWWVSGFPPASYEQYQALAKDQMYKPVFVRVRAMRSGTGSYGHMGGYQRELTILEVLELRDARPDDCGAPHQP